MRMSEKRTKKYPVLSYLCLTLLVCLLFTGVTFSRYTSSQSGNIESALSRFSCSYDITNISSTSFINSTFYIDGKPEAGKMNALRTMTYTARNYEKDDASTVCGEDLKSVLRIFGPYEFISNLAWQLERVEKSFNTVVTPQIVMEDIIKNAPSGKFNTSGSVSYDARAYGATDLTLEGSITETTDQATGTLTKVSGTVRGSWESASGGGEFVFNAYTVKANYSLSFLRTTIMTVNGVQVAGSATTPFIVDFEENIPYCTLDVYLPYQMDFAAKVAAEKSFMLYFTLVNPINGFNKAVHTDYYDQAEGQYGSVKNCAGYHYDAKVAVRTADGTVVNGSEGLPQTDTVRVVRKGEKFSYFKMQTGTIGTSGTELTTEGDYVVDGDKYYAVSDLNDVFRSVEAAVGGKEADYMISTCVDKIYNVQFKMLFLQTSESGGGQP